MLHLSPRRAGTTQSQSRFRSSCRSAHGSHAEPAPEKRREPWPTTRGARHASFIDKARLLQAPRRPKPPCAACMALPFPRRRYIKKQHSGPLPRPTTSPPQYRVVGRGRGPEPRASAQNKGPLPRPTTSPSQYRVVGWGSGPEPPRFSAKQRPSPPPDHLAPTIWVVGRGRGPEPRASAQNKARFPSRPPHPHNLGGWAGERAGTARFNAK